MGFGGESFDMRLDRLGMCLVSILFALGGGLTFVLSWVLWVLCSGYKSWLPGSHLGDGDTFLGSPIFRQTCFSLC